MPYTCRVCARVNPPEALYCYYDGAALDASHAAPLAIGLQPFSHPFVFPSGRTCRNFDELVLACDDDWDAASDLLKRGFLAGFLDGIGRPDLSYAAKEAAKQRDADRGLDLLLRQLPCTARLPASLVVHPLEVNLGQLSGDAAAHFSLHLENRGAGMVYGTITAEADWLMLGDAPGSPRKVVQFHQDLSVAVQIVAENLRAGVKPSAGRLLIETNAGLALVMVRAEVPATPFPRGVLAGALTPRDLARRAKAAPKEAAILFETGVVRRWYEINGWTYPVPGEAAPGLAGVQQFFELLGLAKPPRVVISEITLHLSGKAGESIQYMLQVQALEKKYVFAQARSTVGWLHVASTTALGQRAQVLLRVPTVPHLPGQRLHGFVHVTANGGQRFTVEVHLTVAGERAARTEVEVIPAVGLTEDLLEVVSSGKVPVVHPVEDEEPEVISLAPMRLSDLLDEQAEPPADV